MSIDLNSPRWKFICGFTAEAMALARRIQQETLGKNLLKSDASPVTIADFSIQALFACRLEQAFPDEIFAGEESSALLREHSELLETVVHYVRLSVPSANPEKICRWIDHGNRDRWDKSCWILDPIDGTKGFVRGAQYAVASAFVDSGRILMGGVGCPELNEQCEPQPQSGVMAIAESGKGAWLVSSDGRRLIKQMSVSRQSDVSKAVILGSVEPLHTNMQRLKKLRDILNNSAVPRLMDSLAKYAALADGYGDFFLYFLPVHNPSYRSKIWDVAPGAILVEEAGGRVTDLKGRSLDYSHGITLINNEGLLLSNSLLHPDLLKAIRNC